MTTWTAADHQQAIRELFAVAIECHGRRWTRQHGEADSGIWAGVLDDVSPRSIRWGTRTMAKSADAWPPSPGEFRGTCLAAGRAADSHAPAAVPRLEHRQENRDAWGACQAAYLRRLAPGPFGQVVGRQFTYRGPIPVEAIAAAAPEVDPLDLEATRRGFQALRDLFVAEQAAAHRR